MSHRTRKLAEANLGYPDGWCDECRYGPDDPGVQATKREALPER